ncbi:MAG TPA: radical SAM protein [Spirochaetota bacterium]|nr:radical SAM protein [Spirochaetota bacterium]
MQQIESLYVHYPFCSSKCHYCGFYSTIYDESKESLYLKSLKNELTYYINNYDFRYLKTVYVGGGNPGLNPYFIIRLQEILTSLIELKNIKEYTVECNPLNISSVFLDNCKTSGINRISVGIQSFCDKALIFANRINQNKKVIDTAFTALKGYDFRVSIDLINYLPYSEETEELSAIEDFLIKYPFVNHLSLYDLSIDEGSFFYRELQKNSSSIFLDDSRNFSIEKEKNRL